MTVPESAPDTEPPQRPPASRRTDASPWNWFLLPAIVLPIMTFIYNNDEPRLLGFPMFYWFQFALILVGVGCTTLVYQKTKRRG
mgnify:CR=1 FL=1